jgi:hypothetical protein
MMLIKYFIVISFLNLVLAETCTLVCVEDNNTVKYENILENCCKKDREVLLTNQKTTDTAIQKSTYECCVDYNHNYNYVPEQFVLNFNCKDFNRAEISANKIYTVYNHYDHQKSRIENNCKRDIIKTTVIRI